MADGYLLDTSIASIAFDAGNPSHAEVQTRLRAFGDDPLWICSVSVGEVEYGLHVSPRIDAMRQQTVRKNLHLYTVLKVDRHTGQTYGELRAELFRTYGSQDARGRLKEKRPESLIDRTTSRELGIQENDLWIVSAAVQYNLRFVTRDHMERILEAARKAHSYDRAITWKL